MSKTELLLSVLLMFLGNLCATTRAQSSQLQLNLLLEPTQSLEWAKEYSVLIGDHIPAKIILGNLKNENTLIGFFKVNGTGDRLILHGIESKNQFILHEWLDNSTKTGSLRLINDLDSLSGYWYNQDKSLRLSIHSSHDGSVDRNEIRQYQWESLLFFTRQSDDNELLIENTIVDSTTWKGIQKSYKRCYDIPVNTVEREFCESGNLKLYAYNRIDLARILQGQIPQIPHDEVFNSHLSKWLNNWADQVFQDSISEISEQRWSRSQSIWFIPDYIDNNIISGLLSIQYSGDQMLHSHSIIYDRIKQEFYSPSDFFRSHTPWNGDFQVTARQYIFQKYQSIIEVFPEVMERLKFHMTLNPEGIVISSDFTPYFGRLKVQLAQEDYQDDLQRFSPFRKLLLEQ